MQISTRLRVSRLLADQAGKRTARRQPLDVGTVRDQAAHGFVAVVLFLGEASKTEVVGHVNFLATREFELGATARLDGTVHLVLLAAHGHQDLTDVNTSHLTVGTAESATHTSLKSIRTSARKHLVHAQHVVRLRADLDVEVVTTDVVEHVLVARDTGSFQRFGGNLLVLVRHHVHATRVQVAGLLLATDVEDADLRVRHTSAEAGLRVRLVLTGAVALIRTTTHLGGLVVQSVQPGTN